MLTSLLLALGGCVGSGPRVRLAVAEGRQYCQVFTTPAPWFDARPNTGLEEIHIQYRWPKDTRNAILMTRTQPEEVYRGPSSYPDGVLPFAKFRVSLTLPVEVRVATEQEWQSGTDAATFPSATEDTYGLLGGFRSVDIRTGEKDTRSFSYDGFQLRKSGSIWANFRPVVFSPRQRFAVLQSFNGYDITGKMPFSDDLFIDIYDVAVKRRIVRITGDWSDWTPDAVFNKTAWISDDNLALPFTIDARSFLWCNFSH